MRRLIRSLFAIMIIASGVIMFNYPTIATFVNNVFANREISEYEAAADDLDEEELNAKVALAQAYNQSLPMSFPADPFGGKNLRNFTGTEFEDFELIQPGAMIGYIEIPDISIYQPVYYGTSDEVLDKGLGLVENTSLPVGGKGTHAVISGHTGMATRKLFTDLNLLEKGNIFFVHVLNQHFAYEVDQIKVVWPDETQDLIISKDFDRITLVTCTPFGVNDHRLLVRGSRIDYDFSVEDNTPSFIKSTPAWRKWILTLGAGLLIILFFIILIVLDTRRRARKRRKTDEEDKESSDAGQS